MNLNPVVDGVRPDPAYANIIATVTDAQLIRHELFVNFNVNFASPSANKGTVNWHRLALNGGYSFIRARRNALGPLTCRPAARSRPNGATGLPTIPIGLT